MDRIERYEQDNLVVELCTEVEVMDRDEWQEKYDSLDIDHQIEVDESMDRFADNAIGDPIWRLGTDFEDY